MKYLPYENYRLISNFSVSEIINRINENIEPKKLFRISFGSTFGKPYEGNVNANGFFITRILGYNNSFNPIIIAKFEYDPRGTIIHVKMRISILISIFISLILAFVALTGLAFAIQEFFQPATLLTFIMFGFCYCLTIFGFKYESKKSKNFLKELLGGIEI